MPGVVDLSTEQGPDIPMLIVTLDRAAIARHSRRVFDVAETLETAFAGHTVSQVRDRQRAFPLVIRYGTAAATDLDSIRATIVRSPSGAEVPLHALAQIRHERGPSTISRENVQRKMVVQCNVSGRDLGGVTDDVRRSIAAGVKLPPGYRIEYGGQFESATEASRRLLVFGLAALVAVFALLSVALGSARDAALVLVNLPLAGGAVGVVLAGGTLSVASLVGFITLFGIATRNGLMLVSHIHHVVRVEGETDLAAAVRRGASERLAPILMTALAAGLALVPLALGGGEPGNEIQTPMAIVILCGLLSSTTLNMVVLPALYLRFGAVGLQRDAVESAHVRNPASTSLR